MPLQPIFVTGIGTNVGKTITSAIITQALGADYWKPVQSGSDEGTDCNMVKQLITYQQSVFHPEVYCLKQPVSPHIAALAEHTNINLNNIVAHYQAIQKKSTNRYLVIEGAGGLFVPLNERLFVADLIAELNAKVILVSRNYLGSINHSLLTAKACNHLQLDVIGWIFNDNYLQYEHEIVQWTNIPSIGNIPFSEQINAHWIAEQAQKLKPQIEQLLHPVNND